MGKRLPGAGGGGGGYSHFFFIRSSVHPKRYQEFQAIQKIFEILPTKKKKKRT